MTRILAWLNRHAEAIVIACIIALFIIVLHGCGGGIARDVAKGAIDGAGESIQAKIDALTKAKDSAEHKAAAAVKTSKDAAVLVAAKDQEIQAERKKLQADIADRDALIAEETKLYRSEVSRHLRQWSLVVIVVGAVALALGLWQALANAASPLGIFRALICQGTAGKSLLCAGYVAIGLGVIGFVLAPAWYWIAVGFVGIVAIGVVAALVYEVEHHRGKTKELDAAGKRIATDWAVYAQQLPAETRAAMDKVSQAGQGVLASTIDRWLGK